MSDTPKTSSCCTCGYTWRTGSDGSHICSVYMAATIDMLTTALAETDAALQTARKDERERCAKAVDTLIAYWYGNARSAENVASGVSRRVRASACEECAAAIRALGEEGR